MTASRRFLMPASGPALHTTGTLDIKSMADDATFEGYASLFNREDLGRDVIMPGAFRDSLNKRGARGVKMLFQHNPSEPIGRWEDIREDSRGLFVRGRLEAGVRKAREVMALLRAGALDGLSIGFKAVKGRRDARSGVRHLSEVDLWEISIVTFPMLPDARIVTPKQAARFGETPTARQMERWLTRDAGLTRREARALLTDGLQGLKTLRDAGDEQNGEAALVLKLEAATRHMTRAALTYQRLP